jgi:coenzyme PQQ precursor peptide PqqA
VKEPYIYPDSHNKRSGAYPREEKTMAWTRPAIREICIGMEINGYLPAEI